jgi:DNA primase small subunit
MGKSVPLAGGSLAWCRERFLSYYRDHPPGAPPDLVQREIAFAPFEAPGMFRHLAYDGERSFQDGIQRASPRHVYYSTAYYERPGHSVMKEKRWLGADVIFDLDADHLADAASLSYPEQLERVKKKFQLLVDEYLLGDFGLDVKDLELVFSGGRGYHAHIRDPAYRGLSSAARRELVDYLTGEGFDPLREALGGEARPGPNPASSVPGGAARRGVPSSRSFRRTNRLPPPEAAGWPGRFTRALFGLTRKWEGLTEKELRAWLLAQKDPEGRPHLGPRSASSLARELSDVTTLEKIRQNLTLDVFPFPVPAGFLTLVAEEASLQMRGEADAPVTTDIHRLIRLPGSLHGGTGFRVLPLDRDAVDDFSPWRDALVPHDPGKGVPVRLETAVDYPFLPERLAGAAGEELTLPEPRALFLLLRGEARVLSDAPGAGG